MRACRADVLSLTGEQRGRDSLKQTIRQFRTAFPDAYFSLEGDFIAEGDKVVARWKGVATQKGAFGSIPATGKSATWTGISIFRIAEGKVVEEFKVPYRIDRSRIPKGQNLTFRTISPWK